MVQLVDSDIETREVLGWKGVHVLHYCGVVVLAEASHLSQPEGHRVGVRTPLDLHNNENFSPWFLGIRSARTGAGPGA